MVQFKELLATQFSQFEDIIAVILSEENYRYSKLQQETSQVISKNADLISKQKEAIKEWRVKEIKA